MDAYNAVRQAQELEDILTAKDGLYKDATQIQTPALFNRLQRVRPSSKGQLDVKKCLSFTIDCSVLHPDDNYLSDLMLEFEFPLGYPSDAPCSVKACRRADADVKSGGSSAGYEACTESIRQYLEAFAGFECVELVLDWLADSKDTCLESAEGTVTGISNKNEVGSTSDMVGKVQCYVLRYNHLLSGPEHKKEKSMVDTAKKLKLQGGLLWGTPGVVVVVPPSTEEDAKEYGSDCRTIGKRPDGVEGLWLPQSGVEEAGLWGLAQQKRGGKLQELDTAGMRIVCGGDEDLLRLVLGVH